MGIPAPYATLDFAVPAAALQARGDVNLLHTANAGNVRCKDHRTHEEE